jgi:hypothetical protein
VVQAQGGAERRWMHVPCYELRSRCLCHAIVLEAEGGTPLFRAVVTGVLEKYCIGRRSPCPTKHARIAQCSRAEDKSLCFHLRCPDLDTCGESEQRGVNETRAIQTERHISA